MPLLQKNIEVSELSEPAENHEVSSVKFNILTKILKQASKYLNLSSF